jgi:hypothetical protein
MKTPSSRPPFHPLFKLVGCCGNTETLLLHECTLLNHQNYHAYRTPCRVTQEVEKAYATHCNGREQNRVPGTRDLSRRVRRLRVGEPAARRRRRHCQCHYSGIYILKDKFKKRRRNRSRVSRGGVCKSLFHVL